MLSMMKKVKIEKLEEKFNLISHPFPQISGEMLVFRPRKEDQNEKDFIVFRDYSLRKRLPTSESAKLSVVEQLNKKKKKAETDLQKLQSLEIDYEKPLSEYEWGNFAEVINEMKGLGWFQILPVGMKSSQPYQFNVMHVIPSSKLPVETLPLDLLIKNAISFNRKYERRGISNSAN